MADEVAILLDCDTGIDDALTLAYLAAAPRARLVAVSTVSGNVGAAAAARNTLDVLGLAGATAVPVHVGAANPLAGDFQGGAPFVHGVNGVGDVQLARADRVPEPGDAVEALLRAADQFGEALVVLAIGPLTNLALALRRDADLDRRIAGVVLMGGSVNAGGNVTAYAEANVANDPEAAAEVFAARWPITMVGLDVTMQHLLTEEHRTALLAADRDLPRALGAMLGPYFTAYETFFGRRSAPIHDPLAAMLATGDVSVAEHLVGTVTVNTSRDERRGETRFREDPAGLHRVVLRVQDDVAGLLLLHLVGTSRAVADAH